MTGIPLHVPVGPASHDRRHGAPLEQERRVADGVHAPAQAMEPSSLDPPGDLVLAEPGQEELQDRDYGVPAAGEPHDPLFH